MGWTTKYQITISVAFFLNHTQPSIPNKKDLRLHWSIVALPGAVDMCGSELRTMEIQNYSDILEGQGSNMS